MHISEIKLLSFCVLYALSLGKGSDVQWSTFMKSTGYVTSRSPAVTSIE